MNKPELAAAIADQADLTKTEANELLNAVLDQITLALSRGDAVRLPGLGSFNISERAARTGRNPQTGATLQIAASKGVRFSPASALKDAVKS